MSFVFTSPEEVGHGFMKDESNTSGQNITYKGMSRYGGENMLNQNKSSGLGKVLFKPKAQFCLEVVNDFLAITQSIDALVQVNPKIHNRKGSFLHSEQGFGGKDSARRGGAQDESALGEVNGLS
ncbi:unnamed protein product [Cuscuta epithymum]|uniref:Uncharacterized protein n=1 Tax=Cuscuta epithymum TaxID=186058 RepID=A0AAV0FWL3_9ASTE|nr:unnamed protein product [Cuscuta epithymum]